MYRLFFSFKRFARRLTKAKPHLVHSRKICAEVGETPTKGATTYLFATNTSGNWALLSVDLLLALGLKAIGKHVQFVLCDKILPACQMCEYHHIAPETLLLSGPTKRMCNECYSYSQKLLSSLGMETLQLSHFIEDVETSYAVPPSVREKLDEHAVSGLLRYLGKGDLNNCTAEEMRLLRRFKESSYKTYFAFRQIFRKVQPARVVLHHGIYTPQGSAMQACLDENVPTVCWSITYRKRSILLTHGETYHRSLPAETQADVFNFEFNRDAEEKIDQYLQSREKGLNDWISFSKRMKESDDRSLQEIGLDPELPTYLLLTNVIWDAKLHFASSIYDHMMDWVRDTIRIFQGMPDRQLVIRIHPAEISGSVISRQRVRDEIASSGMALPPNIVVIDADDTVNDTYWLIDKCQTALVFGSKAAIEIASRGKHVVVVGDAWCRGKGFTVDPSTQEDYRRLISDSDFSQEPDRLQVILAKKYAYYLFFRRMIPLENLTALSKFSPLVINPKIPSLSALRNDKNLMKITNALVSGEKFEFEQD